MILYYVESFQLGCRHIVNFLNISTNIFFKTKIYNKFQNAVGRIILENPQIIILYKFLYEIIR